MALRPVGVRFAPETLQALADDAGEGGSLGGRVREIVERFYADEEDTADMSVSLMLAEGETVEDATARISDAVAAVFGIESWLGPSGERLELMGSSELAELLGTTTSNLNKFKWLPEPLYSKKHPDPRYRVKAGSFWDAVVVRELVAARAAARQEGS